MDRKNTQSIPPAAHDEKGGRNISLLRLGVVFLALVSFFTTANGMKTYIFTEDGAIAYAASAAIQSILLALSMNLPRYLQGIWEAGRAQAGAAAGGSGQETKRENARGRQGTGNRVDAGSIWGGFGRLILCAAVIVLTLVTIFSSSWFSYVYIADVIHKDSWDTDSTLLVQQTYRRELYNAKDYAHAYRTYLEETVGSDILLLEQQAQKIGDSISDVEVNWQSERDSYTAGTGMAASFMSSVIPLMENAVQPNASQENRNLAATAIKNARENISSRIGSVQENLVRINGNIGNYNAQIADLTRRVNNAAPGTDISALNASINSLTQLINNSTQQQIELQQESAELDNALMRLPFYESLLGLNNTTSSISIRSRLIQMQSEFFKQDPDDQVLQDTASEIFDDLREAAAGSGADAGTNEFSYTNLLVQMNRLMRNLIDYSQMKEIEANLDTLITNLRAIYEEDLDMNPGQSDLSPEQGELSGQNNPDEQTPPAADPNTDVNPAPSTADTAPENQPDAQRTEEEAAGLEGDTWQEDWRGRLEALKAQISAMPTFKGTEESDADEVHVLTESQMDFLNSYDRNAASAVLDDMVRRYISEHNAIYQGIIYLTSPYKMLAIFALCLAFAFDISGFVFGFVMQGQLQETLEGAPDSSLVPTFAAGLRAKREQAKWSVVEPLHQYRVLTGDFICRDGTYYYKAFRDGYAEQWPVHGTAGRPPYRQGIYCLSEPAQYTGASQGESAAGIESALYKPHELVYSGQRGGPADGIFINSCLIYKDGGLSRKNGKTISFICSLDEFVPVHCYSPAEKVNRTFPVKDLAKKKELTAKIAVVALNRSGASISAVYMIEKDD